MPYITRTRSLKATIKANDPKNLALLGLAMTIALRNKDDIALKQFCRLMEPKIGKFISSKLAPFVTISPDLKAWGEDLY